MLSQLGLHILGKAGALVGHGDHDPGQNQRGVELAANRLQRVEELHEPLERKVLGLDRDDRPVGGGERVDGDRAERRRAVEDRGAEALADRAEPLA